MKISPIAITIIISVLTMVFGALSAHVVTLYANESRLDAKISIQITPINTQLQVLNENVSEIRQIMVGYLQAQALKEK